MLEMNSWKWRCSDCSSLHPSYTGVQWHLSNRGQNIWDISTSGKKDKFREISYKCTADSFERVLKSFTKFARADCSSHNALHQRSWNLSHFAEGCFYPVSCKVATWPLFTHSWVIPQRSFCSEPSSSKAVPWGLQAMPHPKLTAASDWTVYKQLLGDSEAL